jgi:predicted HicB family RNase H-like nuclease
MICPTCGAPRVTGGIRHDRKLTVRVTAPVTAALARHARKRRASVSAHVRAVLEAAVGLEE